MTEPNASMEPPADTLPTGVQMAAGGILRRTTATGTEIAVVHRPSYGDWVLPKGKVEQDEPLERAALREVMEETGCDAELDAFADVISYAAAGQPKIVAFWHMQVIREVPFSPTAEIDHLDWLSPDRALKRLDHAEQRDLLRRTFPRGALRPPLRRRLWTSFRHLFGGSRRLRLGSAVTVWRPQLEEAIAASIGSERRTPSWVVAARRHLSDAETAAESDDVNAGWESLSASRRMALYAVTSPSELEQRSAALRAEGAAKLTGWRKESVASLTEPPNEAAAPGAAAAGAAAAGAAAAGAGSGRAHVVSAGAQAGSASQDADAIRDRLILASSIFDEAAQNRYFKLDLRQSQIKVQLTVLLILVLLLLGMITSGLLRLDAGTGGISVTDPLTVVVVVLFGMLGASLSVLQSLVASPGGDVPEQIASTWLTLIRPFIGGASALVAYVLYLAGIVTLGQSTTAAVFVIAFISGFSERYVTGVVASAAGVTSK